MSADGAVPGGPVDMSVVRRAAIIKLSSIGDVVHALPVADALGASFPGIRWSWVVETEAAPIAELSPVLGSVLVVPRSWRPRFWRPEARRALSKLRRQNFDLVVDLQGLDRSAVLAWISGARSRVGYFRKGRLAPIVNRVVPREPGSVHAVDQYLDVARFLGATTVAPRFPLQPRPEDVTSAAKLARQAGFDIDDVFVTIHPAHANAAKGWPIGHHAALVHELHRETGRPVVVMGGAGDDEAAAAHLARHVPGGVVSLAGRTSLSELVATLAHSALHITVDTGSLHIAAALDVPVVGLFGPTDPLRTGPYGRPTSVITRRDACDRSCRHLRANIPNHLPQRCRSPTSGCMKAIRVEDVLETAMRRLSESGRMSGA